jgi:hypothetical protein
MNQLTNNAYEAEFSRKIHFWGRLTIALALAASMMIPLYLTVIRGYAVNGEILTSGLIFVAGFVGIIWVIEPISYFPVLGPIGTYMSFLSGNIGNMRMPVVGAVQNALDLEPGTRKAEIASTFGLIASNIVNLLILFIVVIGGQALVNALPASFLRAFNYAVPGIFGAMIVSFASRMKPLHIVYTGILGIIVMQLIKLIGRIAPGLGKLLSIGQIGVAAAVAIVFALILAGRAKE